MWKVLGLGPGSRATSVPPATPATPRPKALDFKRTGPKAETKNPNHSLRLGAQPSPCPPKPIQSLQSRRPRDPFVFRTHAKTHAYKQNVMRAYIRRRAVQPPDFPSTQKSAGFASASQGPKPTETLKSQSLKPKPQVLEPSSNQSGARERQGTRPSGKSPNSSILL